MSCPAAPEPYKPTYTVEGEFFQRDGDCGTTPEPGSSSSSSIDEVYPPDGQPDQGGVRTFTFDQLSILCDDIGLSPEMIEGVLAQLLVQHFGSANSIIYPELKHLVWNADPSLTRIQILPINRWDELVDGKLPAVVYSDLGQKQDRVAIGDQYEQPATRPGVQSFARACSGSHRLMCIGENDFQASLLATEVNRWLTEFAHALVQSLPFHDFQVVDQQPPQSFSALGNRIGVALTLTYSYIWAWETSPYGAPLKSAGLHFRQG